MGEGEEEEIIKVRNASFLVRKGRRNTMRKKKNKGDRREGGQ